MILTYAWEQVGMLEKSKLFKQGLFLHRLEIKTMNYKLEKDYKDNDALRHSFNKLATETFGLSFEDWYKNGYWDEKYIPCSIAINDTVISNVSVQIRWILQYH